MGAEKIYQSNDPVERRSPKDSKTTIEKTHTEEIIILLCGQIGTDLNVVRNSLKEIMTTTYNYECEIIKISELIEAKFKKEIKNTETELKRINRCIQAGNRLREEKGSSILSQLAIRKIALSRTMESSEIDIKNQSFKSRRKCFIIDSIKHPEEIELFRLVYTNMIYAIGVFSPYKLRVSNLEGKGIKIPDIHTLIDIDSGEDKSFGQKVEDAFVNSDYFFNIQSKNQSEIKPKVERFLALIFDNGILTPLIEEAAMYKANAAAANSACLSRQVGAAITDKDGNILSLGWNEVPKANGGVYTCSDYPDSRCYNRGYCSNDKKKKEVITKITNELLTKGLINSEDKEKAEEIIKNNGIKSLIEFARSIHAEMHAIIKGSQMTGNKMIGGKLFCTTYPCHNCARHIIFAGIKEVYYIEPYKKSLSIELHSDAICEGEGIGADKSKVQIKMFEGVAPRSFLHFFKMHDNRKMKAKGESENLKTVYPKKTLTLRALHELESIIVRDLSD